jgi:hypothetical protein
LYEYTDMRLYTGVRLYTDVRMYTGVRMYSKASEVLSASVLRNFYIIFTQVM